MIIATYHSSHPDLSDNRRWMAQIEKIKGAYFVCFHGSTEDEARDKAQYFIDTGGKVKPKKVTPSRAEIEDLA